MLVLFLALTVAALIVKVGLLEIKLGQAIDKIDHCDDLLNACRFSPSENEAELRRHNELVAALKEAGEKGATIVIGDNANGIQIQQNSAGAQQKMDNEQTFNYEKASEVLKEISTYFEFPQFQQTFGDNTENVKSIIHSNFADE